MVTLVATANERVSEWQLRRWRRDTLSAYGARSSRNRVYSRALPWSAGAGSLVCSWLVWLPTIYSMY